MNTMAAIVRPSILQNLRDALEPTYVITGEGLDAYADPYAFDITPSVGSPCKQGIWPRPG